MTVSCSQLKQEQDKREAERQELIASVQTEKQNLLTEKIDLVAAKEAVEVELEIAQKAKRFGCFLPC